ncbi:MFS transporter [Nocardioides sp.]|uniref:MFS transporter n=1 Tax=Nocardioides sp. TaxID=35761 RepID=UPI0026094BF0|nr:MFS transporter [Nocardioides sp.]
MCLAAGFTTLLDQSMINLAATAMARDLGATRGELPWLLAAYSLAFGLALVPAGRFGDLRGRRALLVAGVAVFGVGGLISGAASEVGVIIAARLLQGVGGGIISSQVLGLIQDLFGGTRRLRALAAYGVMAGVAGVLGPLVGAVLITVLPPSLGWRAVLVMSAPLAVVTALVGVRLLPAAPSSVVSPDGGRPVGHRPRVRLDLPGLALLATLTLCLLAPFVPVGLRGWQVAAAFAGAAGAAAAFVARERSAGRRDPASVIVPPALAAAPGFVQGTLVSTFWFGAQLAETALVALYLLGDLGVRPLVVALLAVPNAVAFALASGRSWRAVERWGPRVITVALVGQVVLTMLLALVLQGRSAGAAICLLAGVNVLAGLTGGCVDSPNRAATLMHAPEPSRGVAAGFLQLAQRLSATVAIAAVTGIALHAGGADAGLSGLRLAPALWLCAGLEAVALAIAASRHLDRRLASDD